jgi:hypothetical protein
MLAAPAHGKPDLGIPSPDSKQEIELRGAMREN